MFEFFLIVITIGILALLLDKLDPQTKEEYDKYHYPSSGCYESEPDEY